MTPIKTYIANSIVGKKVHFKCDCLLNIDLIGVVKDWELNQNEIIWDVLTESGKVIRIGENHPNMNIEVL